MVEPQIINAEDVIAAAIRPTREYCKRCGRISLVTFNSPIWEEVAGPVWEHSCMCVWCFGILGDERGIAWEEGLVMYPLSLVNHLAAETGEQ
ncbi:hypothetical protein LCGC14_2931900 [marine sediment metagenome]|uniref:Uncharacterized protein n=1 Tax=marine sediment metagenome TaxID=412755 RepID=A0A0F8XKL8_9ZZZZ